MLLAPLLWLAAAASPQDGAPPPPTPYDQVVELELTEGDEAMIEGRGPTAVVEYEVRFEGHLNVFAQSELDLFLQVDDMQAFRTLAADDDSGGGTTPYVSFRVKGGERLAVLVAADPRVTGPLTLQIRAAPETAATRAAAARGNEAVEKARSLLRLGDRAGAQETASAAVAELVGTVGAADSELVHDAADELGRFAQWELRHIGISLPAYELAAEHFARTLPEDHRLQLNSQRKLAIAMEQTGDLAGAREIKATVLAGRERTLPEDHPDLLSARADLAWSMHQMGELADARALHEAVLEARERTLPEDHADVLWSRGELAVLRSHMGDMAGARASYEAVVASYERTLPADHPTLLLFRMNLASSMSKMGDLAGSRAIMEAVVASYERTLHEDHPDLLWARGNLSGSMSRMGDWAGARALQETVVAGYERTLPEDHSRLLMARARLAVSMGVAGDWVGARAMDEAVVAGYERTLPEGHHALLGARLGLAQSLHATGDLAGARALRESVLADFERTRPVGHPDRLVAQSELALSMHALGDLAGARALVLALASGMRARVLAALALAPRRALGTVASENQRLSGIVLLSEGGEAALDRAVFETVETLRLVAGEAARSLSRFESDPELAPILAEAAVVRSALNDLVAGAAREEAGADELAAELTRLTHERDSLEGEASRILFERGVKAHPVESAALAAALGAGEVAVGYRRLVPWDGWDGDEGGVDRVVAYVLAPDGELARVDLGPAAELEELAGAWRAALGAPLLRGVSLDQGEDDPEPASGRALRARLLDPILAAAGADVSRLYLCADDLVFLVPLDALPLEEDERVGDRFEIVNEVSFARLLFGSERVPGEPSLLAFGGVDYGAEGAVPEGLVAASAPIAEDEEDGADEATGTRSALPDRFQKLLQSRFEAEAAAVLFEEAFELEPVLLTRKETTKAALFDAAPGMRYLHVATHGWFAPESVRSIADASSSDSHRMSLEERLTGLAPMTLCGLALAGANNGRDSLGRVPGILTAEELCALDLSQCELAVLSACETNVGIRRAGQGIQSLQAALYAAGARTSITSLWKVDDAATRRLFEVFYTNLWIEQLPKAEALWRAKVTLREEGHPPRDWAGWILTGDPD